MTTRATALACVLLAATLALHRVSRAEEVRPRQTFASFPLQFGGWQGEGDQSLDPKVMAILRVDDYLSRSYHSHAGGRVNFYVGYFQSQRVGQTIHSPMVCLPGNGWQPVTTGRVRIPVQDESTAVNADDQPPRTARAIEVNRLVLANGAQQRQLAVFWYQTGSRVVASDYLAKVYKFVDAVRSNRSDGALLRIVVPIDGPGAEAEKTAERHAVRFVQDVFPLLGAYLPR